jgi:hypothetical protein
VRGILIEIERQRNDANQGVFEELGLGRDLPGHERVFGEPL